MHPGDAAILGMPREACQYRSYVAVDVGCPGHRREIGVTLPRGSAPTHRRDGIGERQRRAGPGVVPGGDARRGRHPAPRLVLALERARHPVRAVDRAEGRRAAQLLHGLDRPPRGVAAPGLRLPLAAERGGLLRRGPRRADHDQQDPGRARPDRDPQGDGAARRCPGATLEGAAQLLPGQGSRRRLHPEHGGRAARGRAGRRDRAVYRYVRRVFSPRFSPIDADNVWSRILPEVQRTPLWQGLAAKAAAEDDRASARTRAGHAARGGTARKPECAPDRDIYRRRASTFFCAHPR